MPEVLGIGGAFLYAENTQELAGWYNRRLGFKLIPMDAGDRNGTWYQEFAQRDLCDPCRERLAVFALMPARQALGLPRSQAMINFRVSGLETLIQQLKEAGIAAAPVSIEPDGQGNGKFTRLQDGEGNPIELWEHIEL